MADMDYDDYNSEEEFDSGKKQRKSTAGRKLMRWNPDVDQFVLLAVEMVCTEQGTPVPWNLVAEKINDYVSGEGIKQHLAKVRKFREQHGRPVPHRSKKGAKAAAYGTGITSTPKKKKGGDDEDLASSGKGAGLLWTNPNAKKSREPKAPKEPKEVQEIKQEAQEVKEAYGGDSAIATPKTPARSHKSAVKPNDEEKAASKKKSTGKRSRTKKKPNITEESEEEYADNSGSPAKKQRSLRPAYRVNYNEAENAAEELDDDVSEARSSQTEDGDGDRDGEHDPSYWSQPGTVMTSGRGSSNSSQYGSKGLGLPMQTPAPNFENLLQQHTGMTSYGEDVSGNRQGPKLGGVFTGLNANYGPNKQQDGSFQGMDVHFGDMAVDQGFNGPHQLTADQLQMQAAQEQFGGYLHRDNHNVQNSPARRLEKHEGAAGDEGKLTTSGKKEKKGKHSSSKRASKYDPVDKKQKGSIHDSKPTTSQGPQQEIGEDITNADAKPYVSDNFGDIPIANDTGRGFSQEFLASMHDYIHPLTTSFTPHQHQQQQQQAQGPTLTTSPTDLGDFMPGLSGQNNYTLHNNNYGVGVGQGGGSTGITPHFNNFSFQDSNANTHIQHPGLNSSHDVTMPQLHNDDYGLYGPTSTGMGLDITTPTNAHFTTYGNGNTSFSSSTDTGTTIDSSQSDQATVPRGAMQFGDDVYMPRWGADAEGEEMDLGGGGLVGDDLYSMLDPEGYA